MMRCDADTANEYANQLPHGDHTAPVIPPPVGVEWAAASASRSCGAPHVRRRQNPSGASSCDAQGQVQGARPRGAAEGRGRGAKRQADNAWLLGQTVSSLDLDFGFPFS